MAGPQTSLYKGLLKCELQLCRIQNIQNSFQLSVNSLRVDLKMEAVYTSETLKITLFLEVIVGKFIPQYSVSCRRRRRFKLSIDIVFAVGTVSLHCVCGSGAS
jgi:hypothetical protein